MRPDPPADEALVPAPMGDRTAAFDGVSSSVATTAPSIRPQTTGRALAVRAPKILLSQRFRVSPRRVFDAWLDPSIARRWLFATATRPNSVVSIDARIGGRFHIADARNGEFAAEWSGEYLDIVAHRRLVFTLAPDARRDTPSRVQVEIEPRRVGCHLVLAHINLPRRDLAQVEMRWVGMFYGLGLLLDAR